MGTERGKVVAAILAQALGQATTGWALLAHLGHWPDVSIWVVAPVAAAALVPFRHDGTFTDRATSNFGASVVVGGMFWWELAMGGLDGLLGGGGLSLGAVGTLMLVAAVLFSVSGALFWLLRERA